MVVLNSRDKHEKTWCPDFTCLNNMPNNIIIATSPSNKLEDRLASGRLLYLQPATS